jgi:uncharacterized metal-binding protein YceD (DUF177 family)
MDDALKIYVDRLRDGNVEQINETISPDFIGVNENDLTFSSPVYIRGQAYLVDDRLVLNLSINTTALCRCIVCNDQVPVDVQIKDHYVEEIINIKGAVFDMADMLREMILLEIPAYFECHEGKCPSRDQLSNYLKKEISTHEQLIKEDDEYHPFKNLSLEDSRVNRKDKEAH